MSSVHVTLSLLLFSGFSAAWFGFRDWDSSGSRADPPQIIVLFDGPTYMMLVAFVQAYIFFALHNAREGGGVV